MELNAEKVKIEFDKKPNGRITRKDINWMQSLHSAGIYIFLSPEDNSVYVGRAKNVYARLEAHYNEDFIEPHFLEKKDRKRSYSRTILTRQDAEMYCCFLEGRNEYDYSSVTDLKKELKNLEGFMMDVMEYNGYKVVNYRKEKYNSSNLKGESLYEEDNIINLGDNIFKFGLGNYLNLQVHTNSHRVKSVIRANEENRERIEIIEKI